LSDHFILGVPDTVDGIYMMSTQSAYDLVGQNVGNLAFHYALTRILGSETPAHPWHEAPEKLNAIGRIGVMPCANQLGPHADFGRMGERFQSLSIPLVAIGLGAQGGAGYADIPIVPEGTINWVRQIAARSPKGAPNIGVRGPFTLAVLEHYGLAEKATITGCPSLFLNTDPKLGEKIELRAQGSFDRIAVTAGHQKWTGLSKIEESLTSMLEPGGANYLIQSPLEMVALARNESETLPEEALAECRNYSKPQLDLAAFNVSEWIEYLRTYDFIVGTRIHGVMLGLQAGIPSLCIAHDSRTREMCEVMDVPFVMANEVIRGLEREDLRRLFKFDGLAFDLNRRARARHLRDFLAENSLDGSAWLNRIIAA
jgi:hypothetical protein